jgi:hypothetical protein
MTTATPGATAMPAIPPGYSLAIVHEGTIVDTISLEGADPTRTVAALSLGDEVAGIVRRHAERLHAAATAPLHTLDEPTVPIHREAMCGTCGETFVPADDDDVEHATREDGTPCGGLAVGVVMCTEHHASPVRATVKTEDADGQLVAAACDLHPIDENDARVARVVYLEW